jgi:hypothetical protein
VSKTRWPICRWPLRVLERRSSQLLTRRRRREGWSRVAPTCSIVFGHTLAGTPIMEVAPHAALDLPLKLVVWHAEDGQTRITCLSWEWLSARYGIPENFAVGLSAPENLGPPRRSLEVIVVAPPRRTTVSPDPDDVPFCASLSPRRRGSRVTRSALVNRRDTGDRSLRILRR